LKKIPNTKFIVSFINGAKVEIKDSNPKNQYHVKFIDNETNRIHYNVDLKGNHWGATNLSYYIEWRIEIYLNKSKVYEHIYNAKNKRILINFESKALGDTLAWFPYLEEFRKKHNCKLIVSTFHNHFFKNQYPEIEFVDKGKIVHNLYAQYNIGWFYNNDKIDYSKNPINFRLHPLSKTCSSILGLDWKEIKPKLSFKKSKPTISGNYICIAPHGSAHAKYWNHPIGWQSIIDYYNKNNYKVVMITKEPLGDDWHDSKLGGTLKGVIDKTGDISLEDRANDLMNAKAFIGIGSGLAWLSWALNTPTVLISGFSKNYTEMESCMRINVPSSDICNGCFNYTKLDPGDWEWCPEHKNTFRQYECTKSITPSTVINTLNKQLKIL
jgi:autotransporter strand-loop-strand O-heptosyltransferase